MKLNGHSSSVARVCSALSIAVFMLVGCGGNTAFRQSSASTSASVKFTSTPPSTAMEAVLYSYRMTASSASDAVVFQLSNAPSGASLSGDTLTWTPTAAQARIPNSFTVIATAAVATATQSWTVTPAGTIRGTRIFSFFTDAGVQTKPDDTTRFPIAALVPNGSGGYVTMPGTGSTDGSFTIPGVPAGNYLLQSGAHNFIATQSSTPDTGFSHLGRADAVFPRLPTQISFTVTGASPIQTEDFLQLYVSNTSGYGIWPLALVGNAATSFTTTVPWTSFLTDSSKGDRAILFQLVGQAAGPYTVQVLKKASAPLSFAQTDGSTTAVTTTLADVPHTGTVHLAFNGSAFAELESAMNPRATEALTLLFFDLDPADVKLGQIGNTPDLVTYLNWNGPINTNVDLGEISYSNPFPSSWSPFVAAQQWVKLNYPVPGTASGFDAFAFITVTTPDLPSTASPITPIVGPATNITINGQSFFNDVSGIGTTPTVQWSPPGVGTATKYQLTILRLFADSQGMASTQSLATFFTAGTSIIVPPNLLVAGNTYIFGLTSAADTGIDVTQTPFRISMPRGNALALSGQMTP